MISVNEAVKIIAQNTIRFPSREVAIESAFSRVLQEDISADRDIPAFNKSLMDGVAINSLSYKNGNRNFLIQGTQPAGKKPLRLKFSDSCIEIMTGAVLPEGCDCVIPLEDVEVNGKTAVIRKSLTIKQFQYLRMQASDHQKGDVLLKKGSILTAPQIAIAASVGKARVRVTVKPKVAIITTGDELVDIECAAKSFQVRKSNSYALKCALETTGLCKAAMFHIKDNKKALKEKIGQLLNKFDILVLSGGVSMGKFDFVPEVLKTLGVKMLFHKVQQKPGKPFWFGKKENKNLVFALPGNPVSTLVCAARYVIPHIKMMVGMENRGQEFAQLNEDVESNTPLTYFCPVKLHYDRQGKLLAGPLKISGSGDFASLTNSDGFIELPAEQNMFKAGYAAKLFRWI